MLFASQHSLIIKNLRSEKSGGAIDPLAPLVPLPLRICDWICENCP